MAQLSLIPIERTHKDVVFTFDEVARDVVAFFKPSGRILEPAAGDGVFLKYLPGADWCEVRDGKDFFDCQERYDWVIGNPPYSVFTEWINHSFEIADNIVYIVPTNKNFNSYKLFETIYRWGGIRTIYHLGPGRKVCDYQELGFAFSATHYQRGYAGPIHIAFREPSNKACSGLGGHAPNCALVQSLIADCNCGLATPPNR